MSTVTCAHERSHALYALAPQRAIAAHHRRLLSPGTPDDALPEPELSIVARRFLDAERAEVADEAARAPRDVEGFLAFFAELEHRGPGQHDPLFSFLEHEATLAQMRWFLTQERAGEAGFDDLVALTQLRMPVRAKLEMARNYWDEMGAGHEGGMHGPMLERLADVLALDEVPGEIVWESLALSNLMAGFALDRRYAFHAVGALGVVELTAPSRCEKVDRGLARLGVAGSARRYYALHAVIDRAHAKRWNAEVLAPLVAERPEVVPLLAEGALCRLRAGARTFARYRRELGANDQIAFDFRAPFTSRAA